MQQIIRKATQRSINRTTRDSRHIAGLMVRKGVYDFKVIKSKARKIKTYGMKSS